MIQKLIERPLFPSEMTKRNLVKISKLREEFFDLLVDCGAYCEPELIVNGEEVYDLKLLAEWERDLDLGACEISLDGVVAEANRSKQLGLSSRKVVEQILVGEFPRPLHADLVSSWGPEIYFDRKEIRQHFDY